MDLEKIRTETKKKLQEELRRLEDSQHYVRGAMDAVDLIVNKIVKAQAEAEATVEAPAAAEPSNG